MQRVMIIDDNLFFVFKIKQYFKHMEIYSYFSPGMFYQELDSNKRAFLEKINETDIFLLDIDIDIGIGIGRG